MRGVHRVVAWLTILAITGTLAGCGRYGRPVRPRPAPAATESSAGALVNPPEPRQVELDEDDERESGN